jgi:hypothetical protein
MTTTNQRTIEFRFKLGERTLNGSILTTGDEDPWLARSYLFARINHALGHSFEEMEERASLLFIQRDNENAHPNRH